MVYHCQLCSEVQKGCTDGYCNECGGKLCCCDDLMCMEGFDFHEEILFTIACTLRRIEKRLR